MDRELCFIINDKRLYLEKVLVDYENIPVFFLTESDGDYYIALCTDIEEYNYYVARVSGADIFNMFCQRKTMRDMFLSGDCYYEVISGNESEEDEVSRHDIAYIDKSILPEEGAMFEILTADIRAYVNNFNSLYLSRDFSPEKKMISGGIYHVSENMDIFVEYKYDNEEYSCVNRFIAYSSLIVGKIKIKEMESKVINYSGEYTDIITEKKVKISKEEEFSWSNYNTIASFAA